jgi:hypothetical protein
MVMGSTWQETIDERWSRFRSFARTTFDRPGFRSEERLPRVEAAKEVLSALRLARTGGPWIDALERLMGTFIGGQRFTSIEPRDLGWLRGLARSSEPALAAAVTDVLDETDPLRSFRSFCDAVEELEAAAGMPSSPRLALRVGSLLNFASQPDSAPLVQPALFARLQRTLGYPWSDQVPVVEQYRRCVMFARDVESRLRRDGLILEDMIDVEALVTRAATDEDFWAPGPEDARPAPAYLSICAVYRDVGIDMREWIEFHRLVGVERFFLYNNFSQDSHLDVLAPYIENGTVWFHDWPMVPAQLEAFDDCLRWHRYDSRWIAFLDTDEFLFSPTGKPLPELLREYERWPGVAVNWAFFSTSGHRVRPAGLVIENYTTRLDTLQHRQVKSIVDPTRVAVGPNPHHFRYLYLSAVDENHEPVAQPFTRSHNLQRLRVNHYYTKSEEEWMAKCEAPRALGDPSPGPRTAEDVEAMRKADEAGIRDDTILMYLAALRARLDGKELQHDAKAGRPSGLQSRE